MVNTLAAPVKYYQGPDILKSLHEYISFIGNKFLVLSDDLVMSIVREDLTRGLGVSDIKWDFSRFGGESTQAEADRVTALAADFDAVIGIGGGKVLDTAKLAADQGKLPVVIIPTTAATDAPCSSMSVVYDENGTFVVSKRTRRNPDVVLVDTQIIAKAPIRMLVAGIGDAFSCYYEARACRQAGAMNYNGGIGTEAAFAIAKLANEILRENAAQAKESAERGVWSPALEKTIEANIYLGGVGFENNGCAIAHGVYNGMTAVIKPFPAMHGEAVAVGVLVQLAAEKIPSSEWLDILDFYRSVGLPTKLSELGIKDLTDDILREISEKSCTVSPNVHKMPFPVTPTVLYEAFQIVERGAV